MSEFGSDQPPRGPDDVVGVLKALADPSRLRLLLALDTVELTVGELCRVIGQSQPRTSRHLKVLVEAGVVERQPEGTRVFYRLVPDGVAADLAGVAMAAVGTADPVTKRDGARLEQVRAERSAAADEYFGRVARRWDQVRPLHVDEVDVERAILTAARIDPNEPIEAVLDIGTGTGRMLEVFAPHVQRGLGVDMSRGMLNVARTRLDEAGARHCRVRHGDVYDLDLDPGSFDVAVLHHVLHFLDDPASALAQVARTLRPGGRLVVVDFAPHSVEELRTDFAHRRLGFADDDVNSWLVAADLEPDGSNRLDRADAGPAALTTVLWSAVRWPSLGSPLNSPRSAVRRRTGVGPSASDTSRTLSNSASSRLDVA